VPFIFTNREGGFSAPPFDSANLGDHVGDNPEFVTRNRAQLESQLGIAIQFMNQVHGDTVVLVEEIVSTPTCDALITTSKHCAVVQLVKDKNLYYTP